ncbi:EamA family transporter RarD [Hyphobacterium sp. HN65]|uniref:EamA family transporter RarD n=1 Tax=Hyphobacterium lacteum TaxID=3116575 RepID=A0ABU7LTQ3_9PROT|nr:EamA family transporter RarD [Hyphobacterium sp. HN65]MEE2527297.1 EamA family transporter RarD [Hyphobacterium sp. HN65]
MTTSATSPARAGLAAVASYTIWGLSPIFYKLLGFASASEIVLHRAVWSVPTLAIFIWLARSWTQVVSVLTRPKTLGLLVLSAMLIAANWWLFIFAVNADRVLEVSLGYYINPLVNVAVGIIVFREDFGWWRAAAIALAAIGVINQILTVGTLPLIALALAGSFTIYAYIRKTIAADGRVGLFIETLVIFLPSIIALSFIETSPEGHFFDGPLQASLLILSGPMTVAPLLLFIIGARGLHFATVGLLQFIAPSLQFAVGVAYGEPFSPGHAITFGFIWAGLACFAVSMIRRRKALPA